MSTSETNRQPGGKNVIIVCFGHARIHFFYLKYECVGFCVGCRLAVPTLQYRVEFYRCCGKAKLQPIFTPTQSQTFIVVVGPEVALRSSLRGVDSEHRQELTRAVCM